MGNIAINTFRELLRNRILTIILFFACVLIGFSEVLAGLSLGQTNRIILDFWLAMIEIGGLIAVIFVGGQILFKEIEGKTIYLILSKPIARSSFILGKFLGFGATILLITALQAGILTGILFLEHIPLDPLLITAFTAILIKLLSVFAIILFFSTFASPLLSILFTLGVYIAAHSANGVLDMVIRLKNEMMIHATQTIITILPPFEALNTAKNTLGTPIGISALAYATTFGMAILYLALILLATVIIFERKKFENA